MTIDLAFLQSRDGARRVLAGPGGGLHELWPGVETFPDFSMMKALHCRYKMPPHEQQNLTCVVFDEGLVGSSASICGSVCPTKNTLPVTCQAKQTSTPPKKPKQNQTETINFRMKKNMNPGGNGNDKRTTTSSFLCWITPRSHRTFLGTFFSSCSLSTRLADRTPSQYSSNRFDQFIMIRFGITFPVLHTPT